MNALLYLCFIVFIISIKCFISNCPNVVLHFIDCLISFYILNYLIFFFLLVLNECIVVFVFHCVHYFHRMFYFKLSKCFISLFPLIVLSLICSLILRGRILHILVRAKQLVAKKPFIFLTL